MKGCALIRLVKHVVLTSQRICVVCDYLAISSSISFHHREARSCKPRCKGESHGGFQQDEGLCKRASIRLCLPSDVMRHVPSPCMRLRPQSRSNGNLKGSLADAAISLCEIGQLSPQNACPVRGWTQKSGFVQGQHHFFFMLKQVHMCQFLLPVLGSKMHQQLTTRCEHLHLG